MEEKDSRDIKIDISKKPKVEAEDWKIMRLTAACKKRAYVEKWEMAFLISPHMLEKVGTVCMLASFMAQGLPASNFPWPYGSFAFSGVPFSFLVNCLYFYHYVSLVTFPGHKNL